MDSTREILVETLKMTSYLMFEISKGEVITNVWSKYPSVEAENRLKFISNHLSDIRNDKIIDLSIAAVRKVFANREPRVIEYRTVREDKVARILARIIPDLTNEDYVFIVIENIDANDRIEVVEDKWKLALDASGDGMWDANLVTGNIFFSAKWHEIFGYGPDEIKRSEDWTSKVHPDDLKLAAQNLQSYIEGKTPLYSAELRYRCKDGSYKWILSRGVIASRSEDGKPIRFIGTHTDIQQRKLNEQSLAESEERYRILFDYSAAMICTHDLQGVLRTVNPFTSKMLGFTREEMIGESLTKFIPRKLVPRFEQDYLQAVVRNGKAEGIMQVICKDGQKRSLLYHNYLFHENNNVPFIIGFAQDVTDRISAEEALRQSMDTFSSVFTYSGIGMAIVSPEGKWLDVNNAICKLTGYSKEELLSLNFHDVTHPDDLEADLRMIRQMLGKRIETYTLEKRYMRKDGQAVWVSLTVSMVWNKDDTPKFFIAQIIDISQNKALLDEIKSKNEELEHTQINLINKISQLEELSYIIAHNLRGPSNNIKLLSNIIQGHYGVASVSEEAAMMMDSITAQEAAGMIDEAAGALIGTLELLMAISQIQLNKKIPYDDCDIPDVIQRVCSQLKGYIIEKSAEIQLNLTVDKVSYPLPYLENIFYNLISNALKYSKSDIHPVVQIGAYQRENNTILVVRDNGLGMDLEKHGHRLFKLNQVFHNNKDSKGVGLYLVKTQIESLGGSINANSKVGEGMEFVVTL